MARPRTAYPAQWAELDKVRPRDHFRVPRIQDWRSHWCLSHYTEFRNELLLAVKYVSYLASVYADFCRPTGLESAGHRPGTYSLWNHQGYHKNCQCMEKLNTTQYGKTI